MPTHSDRPRPVPAAARVLGALQAEEALLPGQVSALRRGGATFLALLVLGVVPFFLAANAVGLIGDVPAAIAKSGNSGPGGGGDDDDSSGPGGGGDDDDDTGTHTRTGRGNAATDDTSRNGHSTRGTTNDNDTRTDTGTHTRTRGQTQTRTQGQTRTRTGS